MGKTVEKNCKACGQKITVRLADHKRGWGRFCDKSCSAAYKTGQRPRDVNAHHAKFSAWADTQVRIRESRPVEAAPTIKKQIGHKPKVKPRYHSPNFCRDCGEQINGPGLCFDCETEREALNAMEAGWDGHKHG